LIALRPFRTKAAASLACSRYRLQGSRNDNYCLLETHAAPNRVSSIAMSAPAKSDSNAKRAKTWAPSKTAGACSAQSCLKRAAEGHQRAFKVRCLHDDLSGHQWWACL